MRKYDGHDHHPLPAEIEPTEKCLVRGGTAVWSLLKSQKIGPYHPGDGVVIRGRLFYQSYHRR